MPDAQAAADAIVEDLLASAPRADSVERMAAYDKLPAAFKPIWQEYGWELKEALNVKKINAALKKHSSDVVAKALAKKCEDIRQRKQFNKLTTVEFK